MLVLTDFTVSGALAARNRHQSTPYRLAGETPSGVDRAAAAAAAAGGGAPPGGASILQLLPATSWRRCAECMPGQGMFWEGRGGASATGPAQRQEWPGPEMPALYLHWEAPFCFSGRSRVSCRHFVKLQGRHLVSVHKP